MWKYAVELSYEGTQYCGWQKQKGSAADGKPSIQATIEAALSRITSEDVTIVGSGRTDSGVHAVGQVAHFVLKLKQWPTSVLENGLNSILSTEIRALKVSLVDLDFHAQRSAKKKQYSYYFQQGPCALPHLEPYSWWIRKTLDLGAMQEALSHLIGQHDFKPFQSSGAKPGPTVREIFEATVSRQTIAFPELVVSATGDGRGDPGGIGLVRVKVVGSGFLKQMVRGIAGTLLQIGEGRRDPQEMRRILESQERQEVGPTAPSRALWLEKVWY